MTQKIMRMKSQLCDFASQQMDRGLENVDARDMGLLIDMIKDLAKAEKDCMEAEYYDSVVEAMQGGYGGDMGYSGNMRGGYGYTGGNSNGNGSNGSMGYKNQYGSNWGPNPSNRRSNRRGYSDDAVENMKAVMQSADPQRKEQLMADLQELMQEMR